MSESSKKYPTTDQSLIPFLPHVSLWLILVAALGFRLYIAANTTIANLDGCLYLHQARAIYYGLWDALVACNYELIHGHVSPYPFFVVGAYTVLGDWVAAGRLVNIAFGTATLVPLYLLAKRFFDLRISGLIALVYALTPNLAAWHTDLLRGPPSWFFLVLGMYWFVLALDGRGRNFLTLSGLSFVLATCGRIEGAGFIVVSAGFILISKIEKKTLSLVYFIWPVLTAMAGSMIAVLVYHIRAGDIFSIHFTFQELVHGPAAEGSNIRAALEILRRHPPHGIPFEFLVITRNLVWWIALGATTHAFMEAFWYPFFLIVLIGCGTLSARLRTDRRILYFALLAATLFSGLYVGVLSTWHDIHRYWVPLVLPCFIFLGFGLEWIINVLEARFALKKKTVIILAILFVISVSIPKNIAPREADKLVFKEIGQMIHDRERQNRTINITSSALTGALAWVYFYANLEVTGAPCPRPDQSHFTDILAAYPDGFVKHLRNRDMKYFLWVEKAWPENKPNFFTGGYGQGLIEIGRWNHADTGDMVLFQVP